MAFVASVRRDEALDFARRCEAALEAAKAAGDPAWKIEGLEEAVRDAHEAAEDFNKF